MIIVLLSMLMVAALLPLQAWAMEDTGSGGYTLYLWDNYQGGGSYPETIEGITTYVLPERTREGYINTCWCTSSDPGMGGGTTYNTGAEITLDRDLNLHAIWAKADDLTLKFSGCDDNEYEKEIGNLKYGQEVEIPEVELTREGYAFMGWGDSKTGEAVYSAGDKFKIKSNTVLYGIWANASLEEIPPEGDWYLYFAGMRWRVIGQSEADALLIAAEVLGGESTWEQARESCKNLLDILPFSSMEKAAIKSVSQNDPDEPLDPSVTRKGVDLRGARLFLLSGQEAERYFTNNDDRKPGGWWLRSYCSKRDDPNYYAEYVSTEGQLRYDENVTCGIRPAFVLDRESVLFSSAAAGGKSSVSADSGFGVFQDGGTGDKKLTIIDKDRIDFEADIDGDDSAEVESGETVGISFSGAVVSPGKTNEYVSAMLCSSEGTVLGYASMTPESSEDTWELTLPELEDGFYTLKVFSEQANGDNKTDYASPMIPITLAVGDVEPEKEEKPNASFTASGADSGILSNVTAGMEYSIDGGTNYTEIEGNSVTISSGVTAEKGIRVYKPGNGTTTSDSDVQEISVYKAVKPAEDDIDKTDCTTSESSDGWIGGISASMEYLKSGDSQWTAVTGDAISGLSQGTYYIRLKASGSTLASDALEVTIAVYVGPELVAEPTFSPAGGTYTEAQTVTISCSTVGAEIYYTTDGSAPYSGSTYYTGPIRVAVTTILKAFALKDGVESETASANYIIQAPQPPAPAKYAVTVTKGTGGGSYEEGASVTISANAPGDGERFKEWLGTDGLTFTSGSRATATATFKMPAREVSVNAVYEAAPEPPIPHTHSYTSKVTKDPNCTEKGIRTYTCSCGDSYTEEISALGHDYDGGVITKEPTTSEEGVRTFTCRRCGHAYTEAIPKLNGDLLLYEKAGENDELRISKKLKQNDKFTLIPKFADGRVLNQRVVWASSNPGVASVAQDGKVKALSPGQTTVTVCSEEDPGLTAYCNISVMDSVTAVALNMTGYEFGIGESVVLTAQILPFTAEQKLAWTANNENVSIEVSDDTLSAKVTGKGAGKAKIIVRAEDGSRKKAECSFKIGNPVHEFTIGDEDWKKSVQAGRNNHIKVNWRGSIPKNRTLKWSITASDGGEAFAIASIDSNGVLTGIMPGKVIVTATSIANPSMKASAEYTVTAPEFKGMKKVTGIQFTNKDSLAKALLTGKKRSVGYTFTLSGEGRGPDRSTIAWFSSDPSVATVKTVSRHGAKITALAPGKVTITAMARDAADLATAPSDSVTFEVYARVKSVKLDKKILRIGTQEGTQYGLVSIAAMVPDNAKDVSIKWTAPNKNVRLAAVPDGKDPSTGNFAEPGAEVTIKDGEALAVMGVAPGTAKLKGITMDGSNKKVSCTVNVRGQVTGLWLTASAGKNGLKDVTLADDEATPDVIEYTGGMKADSSMTLKPVADINGVSGSASDKEIKKTYAAYKKYTDTSVSYRSSDTSVATVSKSGSIHVNKGVAAGKTATVYVESADGRQKASIRITVK